MIYSSKQQKVALAALAKFAQAISETSFQVALVKERPVFRNIKCCFSLEKRLKGSKKWTSIAENWMPSDTPIEDMVSTLSWELFKADPKPTANSLAYIGDTLQSVFISSEQSERGIFAERVLRKYNPGTRLEFEFVIKDGKCTGRILGPYHWTGLKLELAEFDETTK